MPWSSSLGVAYIAWAAFVILWNVTGGRSGRAAVTLEPQRQRPFQLVLAAGIVLMAVAPTRRSAPGLWRIPEPFDWALLPLLLAGMLFCLWARVHLGRQWSADVARQADHHVVQTGPYRWVRHPIYTGFIVVYIALAVLCGSWLAWLAFALLVVGLWLKARAEERFLIDTLGAAAYGAYQARTPMLIPTFMPRGQA